MRIRLKHKQLARELSRKRLSQNAWAQRLGLSSSHLSMLVNGERRYPNAETRRKLLDGLGADFEDLFRVEKSRASTFGPIRFVMDEEVGKGIIVAMQSIVQDLRFGVRVLFKRPLVTIVAVTTLALGIGANTAIYSVVDAVLLRPLPYPGSDRMVVIWETNPTLGVRRAGPSGPTYLDWVEQSRSFEVLVLTEAGTGTVAGADEPEQVAGMRVTVNLFELLGREAELGRTFLPEESVGGRHNSIIFSNRYWKTRLGADPDIIGQTRSGDGLEYTVIGVMPEDFWTPVPSDVFVPWWDEELRQMSRQSRSFGVFGRLREGVSPEQASSELNLIASQLAEDYPEDMRGWGVEILPLKDALFAHARNALLVLLGAVALVLLIACSNVANLLLAKAAGRHTEMSIRTSLGAGRTRLIRQVLTEGLLLGTIGGAAGLLLGAWGLEFLKTILPRTIPIPDGSAEVLLPAISIDSRVLFFALVATFLTSVLFTLVPALQATHPGGLQALCRGGRAATPMGPRIRNLLVVSEVAVALVLMIGAGLMIQSFMHLRQVDPGIRAEGVLTMEIELPTDSRYQQGEEQFDFFHRVAEAVREIPEVESAAVAECVPLDQRIEGRSFTIEGSGESEDTRFLAQYRRIGVGYLETMGIPLRAGRRFEDHDDSESVGVAVIDQTLANRYFPGRDPIGQQIRIRDGWDAPRRVIGIAGAVKQAGLDSEPEPTLYVPHAQRPAFRMKIVVRSAMDTPKLTRAVKEAVWSIDSRQPVYDIRSMGELIENSFATRRITFLLLGAFALVAVVLAAIGIYGVMSYTVAQRTQEIGIRMALGAQAGDMLRMVVRQGMAPVFIGIGVGLAGALAVTQTLSSLLYGLPSRDPLTFLAVALLLGVASALVGCIPAYRASRLDPVVALGDD